MLNLVSGRCDPAWVEMVWRCVGWAHLELEGLSLEGLEDRDLSDGLLETVSQLPRLRCLWVRELRGRQMEILDRGSLKGSIKQFHFVGGK